MRFDGNQPAVPLPPLEQGVRPAQPVIEAERIVEPTAMARNNDARNNLIKRATDFADQQQSNLQAYTRKGAATSGPLLSGKLLDTYA